MKIISILFIALLFSCQKTPSATPARTVHLHYSGQMLKDPQGQSFLTDFKKIDETYTINSGDYLNKKLVAPPSYSWYAVVYCNGDTIYEANLPLHEIDVKIP